MGKPLVVLGIVATMAATSAFGQANPGSRDATNDVKSESLGTPGQPTDAMTQYLQQRALNNLPGQQNARTNNSKLGPARAAKAAELIAGAAVNDKTGVAIAKIEEVDPDGVVVSTALGKVKLPTNAFGHNNAGLLLDTTKAEFDQVVTKANAAS